MLELKKIREDLKNIRYYYQRKDKMSEAFKAIGVNDIMATIERYNNAVCRAKPKLFELYMYLYIEGFTQEGYAKEFNYGTEYVQKLNKQLLKFLQEQLD